ncbi:MAG TPA: hypothetical protein VN673_01235 [Clostridia bacterium]|nr:hypothetical protein [Clostridia bacterium]
MKQTVPTTTTKDLTPEEVLRHVEARIDHTAIARLSEMTKRFNAETPGTLLLKALHLAEPLLARESKEKGMFDSIEAAWDFECRQGRWHEAVGFDENDVLAWTDGERLRPISLKASLRWVIRMQRKFDDGCAEQGCDGDGVQARWFKLLLKEMK